jgi:hypothetical protein
MSVKISPSSWVQGKRDIHTSVRFPSRRYERQSLPPRLVFELNDLLDAIPTLHGFKVAHLSALSEQFRKETLKKSERTAP